MTRFPLYCVAALATTLPLAAQQPRDSVRLAELVVTATREVTPARLRATALDVIDATERDRRQITRLADALKLVSGATLVATGAPGGTVSPFFRGVNSNQTLLLIDGIRVNDANANPGSLLGGFDLSGGDRLEVARGAQSTSFGGAAIGGVIAISGLMPATGTRGRVESEAGSFGTFRARGSGSTRSGRLAVSGAASVVDTDNQRPDNQYEQRAQQLRLDYQLSGRASLGATFRGLQQRYTSPGDIRTSNTTPTGTSRFDHTLATVFADVLLGSAWSTRLTLGGQEYFLEGTSRFNGGDPFISRLESSRRVLDWQHRVAAGRSVTMVGGINAEWTDVTDGDGTRDERLRAGYAQATFTPTADLQFTLGGRHDDYTTFGGRTTGRAAAAYYVAAADLKLRATLGTGFMPPSLAARFGGTFQRANPDIRPERSTSFDAGLDRFFAAGRGVASVTVFRNDLTDLIGFESAPFPDLGRAVNIDRARTWGVEVSGRLEVGAVDARLGYTWLNAENLGADAAERRLLRRPAHALGADVTWRRDRFVAGIGATGSLNRVDADFNAFPANRVNPGDYLDARFHAQIAITDLVRATLRAENLFDERYEEVYGFPALGRRIAVGLSFGGGR